MFLNSQQLLFIVRTLRTHVNKKVDILTTIPKGHQDFFLIGQERDEMIAMNF